MTRTPQKPPRPGPAVPPFPLPYTTVDVVIFTVLDDLLQVLLVQRPNHSGAHQLVRA